MKNLKKLVSVVLAVSMLLSVMAFSVSAATFTDVAETDSAYEAVEVLAALKILEGKEAGSFDPAGDIKRSEFAAVVCRAMNEEASAKGSIGGTSFADVAADHWAAGYINWAAQRGIVNGRDENTFDPDAPVTYQEAVKMLVVALGFEVMAQKKGGYPTGYMVVGSNYGITKGVSMNPATGNASRGDVAKLVYNALDCPLMDTAFISLSDEDEYLVYDGSAKANYERRTLLSYYHNIAKVKATVEGTYKTSANLINNKGEKQVKLAISNYYKFTETAVEEILGANITNNEITLLAFDEAADFLGYTVVAYLAENEDNKVELVALVADSKSVETIEISDVSSIATSNIVNGAVVFEYYENADTSNKTTVSFVPAANVKVYENGQEVTVNALAKVEALDANTSANKVILLGDDTGYFSKVFLTTYDYNVVTSVDADKEIIRTEGKTYRLSEEENAAVANFVYNIYKDGAAIGIADIAEGDLLNVVKGLDGNSNVLYYDIYVTSNTVEGTVEAVSTTNGDTVYDINGVQYIAHNNAPSLRAGDNGSFIITIDGKLYDAEITKSYADNYAFILDIGKATGNNTLIDGTWKLEILTKDNVVAIKDVANKINFNGTPVKEAALDAALDTIYDRIYVFDAQQNKDVLIADATVATNLQYRLITYKETDGVITDITVAGSDADFNIAAIGAGNTYKPTVDKFAGYTITDTTVLFSVPVNNNVVDADAAQVYPFSNLRDDQNYAGYIYSTDINDKTFGAAVTYTAPAFSGQSSALAVLKSVSSGLDAAGNPTSIVNLYQAGEEKKVAISSDGLSTTAPNAITSFTAGDVVYGDVIHYTTNANGEINAAMLVYDYSTKTIQAGLNALNPDITYELGLVQEVGAKAVGLVDSVTGTAAPLYYTWDIDEASTNVVFDVAKAANNVNNAFKVYVEDRDYLEEYDHELVTADHDANVLTPDTAEESFKSAAYVLVTRMVDDEIVDVIAYKYDLRDKSIDRFLATFTY